MQCLFSNVTGPYFQIFFILKTFAKKKTNQKTPKNNIKGSGTTEERAHLNYRKQTIKKTKLKVGSLIKNKRHKAEITSAKSKKEKRQNDPILKSDGDHENIILRLLEM